MTKTIGPSPLKVALFYLLLILLIVLPTIGLLLWGFTGPVPYLLHRQSFELRWTNKILKYENYNVEAHVAESASEARKKAKRLFDSTPAKTRVKTLNVYRYTRSDEKRSGIILPLEEYVFRVEAADRPSLDKAILKIPYITENRDTNTLYTLFEEQQKSIFSALVSYIFLLFLFFAKGGAAAAQIKPGALKRPKIKGELKTMLLELDSLDIPFSVTEKHNDELVCQWRVADQNWSKVLRAGGLRIHHRINLKVDSENHIVRSTTTKKIIRWKVGGRSFFSYFSWSRSIDFYSYSGETQYGLDYRQGRWQVVKDYSYQYDVNQIRDPIVRLVIDSGWTYRPVLGFSPLLR